MPKVFELRVSGKRLLVSLLVTAAPISLAVLAASSRAGEEAERAAGRHLLAITESVAAVVQERVRATVIEAALMATDSAILSIVLESNRQYERKRDEDILAGMQRLDEVWLAPAGQALVQRVLSNPASESLRRKLAIQPTFLRITVTDRRGATVAATHKTLDYYQADEQYWQDIFATGRGAVSLTDVLYDDATRTFYIGVGVPVVDETNTLVGTFDAVVDIAALFPLLHQPDLGLGGHMELVKSDGTVIGGTRAVSLASRTKSFDYAAIRDSFGAREDASPSSFVRTRFPGGRDALLAYADTGLKRDFRKLDWFVVGAQDASTLLASASVTQLPIMLVALLSLAGIVFLAVYLSLHAQSEIEEFDEQLHRV